MVESKVESKEETKSEVESQEESKISLDRHVKKLERMRRYGKKLLRFIEDNDVNPLLLKSIFTYANKRLKLEVHKVEITEINEEADA